MKKFLTVLKYLAILTLLLVILVGVFFHKEIKMKAAEEYLFQADTHLGEGKRDLAIEKFKKALLLSPGHIDALVAVSLALYQEERYPEARIYAEKGLKQIELQEAFEHAENMLLLTGIVSESQKENPLKLD